EDPCAVRIAPEGRAAHTPHADRGDGEGGSPATMDGDVVGTPAYMAPEQARGEVRRIDQRADVYAIGAMLYEVLAGRPPYANGGDPASQRTVLARVLAGAPAPLHTLDGSLAGTELAAICDRAMAREPEQRYRDMRALADDLRAYLEVRVVDAYERGTFAELRKWMQRNRALTTASALGVVALVAGLVASLLLMNRVEGQARRAERNAVWASDAVDSLLTKIAEEQLEDAPAAQPLRRELLREAVRFLREFVAVRRDDAGSAEELYRAYARLATAHIQLAEFDQAAEATRRAADLVDALLTDQPGRVDLRADRCWLRDMEACELLRRQQPAAARDLWERALVELRALHDRHPEDARVLARLGSVLTNLAVARRTERAHDEAAVLSAESIDIGRKALALDGSRANEDSLAGRIANYAAQLLALSRDAEAEQVANGHLQVLDRLLDAEPGRRQLAAARANLRNVQGLLRRRASDDAAAEALFARASTEWQQLVDSHPDLPRYRHNLAGALLNRARVLVELGQRTAAAATFDAAVTHMETVLRSDPGTAEYRQRMRRAAVEAGTAHARSGDHQTAARHAARLLALTGLGARPRRDAASLYCQCARLTASDADRTLHADYRRRATELIDALLEDGVLDAADLARTPWRWVR
ncbi:MAG TPA: hypothetical protein VK081_00130, partial [Planctomycetota bacterium]|nr:hypothetical protein [Planctomycetota bacterium]